jgi:SAM-dependent methyltransferase
MKKLTELVRIRELLKTEYTTQDITLGINTLENRIDAIANETPLADVQTEINQLVGDFSRLHLDLQFSQSRFDLIIDKINQQIQVESARLFTNNYELELRVEEEAVSNIRKVRVMELSDSLQTEIHNRIQLNTNWKYPALEIGCRDGEWTKHIVAADPLYITDHYRDFLQSTASQFPDEYQRRIRPYLVKDTNFDVLPQGQFGFVFCWNFLNYRSLDTIKEYLKSIKELLRPGGMFMFSYNNGDIVESAGYAEGFWMSYMPKSMLIPMCESLGFELYYDRDVRGEGTTVSWLELKRPGTLETVKAHQVLGEIKRRDH